MGAAVARRMASPIFFLFARVRTFITPLHYAALRQYRHQKWSRSLAAFMASERLFLVPPLLAVETPTRTSAALVVQTLVTSAPLLVQTLVVLVAAVAVVVVGAPAGRLCRPSVVVVGAVLAAASVMGAVLASVVYLLGEGLQTGIPLPGRTWGGAVVAVFLENA